MRWWWWCLLLQTVCLQVVQTTITGDPLSCPSTWVGFESSCYLFVRSLQLPREEARVYCESKFANASLVSANTIEEATFLANYLVANDFARKSWHTGGSRQFDEWLWQDDPARLGYNFWLTPPKSDENAVTFAYSRGTYGLSSSRPAVSLPFICELQKWRALQMNTRPPYEYGVNFGIEAPRAPKFLREPTDAVFYTQNSKTWVLIECEAEGYPLPEITWYQEAGGSRQIDLQVSTRMALVNGSLLIQHVQPEDYGVYYCVAKNSYGTVRSKSANLRSSYMKDFEHTRLGVYATMNKGTSLSCDAPDHFPQNVGFSWIYEEVKQFVSENERVFVSGDGTLYFSYLVKSDAYRYACNLIDAERHSGHYGPFFLLQVVAADDKPSKIAPEILPEFIKPNPVTPLFGQAATLECFAYGKPAPLYKWERLERPLGNSTQVVSFGRRLVFRALSLDDQGMYRCTATNSEGSQFRDYFLRVASKPRLLNDMQDQFAHSDSSVTFMCDIFALPEAQLEWFRNGEPLQALLLPPEDIQRIKIEDNRLHIHSVKQRDAGVYQCVASNEYGVVGSDARLIVRSFAPSFSKQPKLPVYYAFENADMILPCEPEASPAPLFSWRKDVQLSYGGRFSLLPTGSLRISSIQLSDAGRYVCQASNGFGVESYTVLLNVMAPPKACVVPSQKVAEPNTLATVACQVDGTETLDTTFSWRLNNLPFDSFPSQSNSERIQISNMTALDSGTYTCRVDTVAGHVSNSTSLQIAKLPFAPIGVSVSELSETTAYLNWRMPDLYSQGGDVGYYRVEARLAGIQSWNVSEAKIDSSHPKVAHRSVRGHFLPNMPYEFRVYAGNSVGLSEASKIVTTKFEKPGPPNAAPYNVAANLVDTGEFLITWTAVKGLVVDYVVRWSSFEKPSVVHQLVVNKTSVSLWLDNTACTEYHVWITARNQAGEGPASPMSTVISGIVIPSVAPSDVTVFVLNSTSVDVQWALGSEGNDSARANCAPLQGLLLEMWSEGSVTDTRQYTLHSNSRSHRLTDLRPGAKYFAALRAWNAVGQGPRSSKVPFTMYKAAPGTYPLEVEVRGGLKYIPVDKTGLRLQWSKVKTKDSEESVDGYKIYLYHGASDIPQILTIDSKSVQHLSSPKADLIGLLPYEEYSVQILAYSRGGDGPLSAPLYAATKTRSAKSSSGGPLSLQTAALLLSITVLWCTFR